MKYIVGLILVSASYIAGYLTPKMDASIVAAALTSAVSDESKDASGESPQVTVDSADAGRVAPPATHTKVEMDTEDGAQSSSEPAPVAQTQLSPAPVVTNHSSGSAERRPLTDEQIDKLVPAPFNQYLKGHDAGLLEKYRKFSEQENPSSQDNEILNKISDAITSNPYSKFLNIESFQCKDNFCEIRLYESKPGVWTYIQAEMSLQDWWKFQSSHATGFPSGKDNINGWYVLLMME